MGIKYTKYMAKPHTDSSGNLSKTKVCGIKSNCNSSRVTYILELVDIAKSQFNFLSDEDIRVVSYDGNYWKRQTGIEFQVPIETPLPNGWIELEKIPDLLAGN